MKYKPDKFYSENINDLVESEMIQKGGYGSGIRGHTTVRTEEVFQRPRTELFNLFNKENEFWGKLRQKTPDLEQFREKVKNIKNFITYVKDIPVDRVHPGQSTVTSSQLDVALHRLSSETTDPSDDTIIAFKFHGEYHVQDGHHRASAAILSGKSHVKAKVYDLDRLEELASRS